MIRQYERGHEEDDDYVDPELEKQYQEFTKKGDFADDIHGHEEEEEVVASK